MHPPSPQIPSWCRLGARHGSCAPAGPQTGQRLPSIAGLDGWSTAAAAGRRIVPAAGSWPRRRPGHQASGGECARAFLMCFTTAYICAPAMRGPCAVMGWWGPGLRAAGESGSLLPPHCLLQLHPLILLCLSPAFGAAGNRPPRPDPRAPRRRKQPSLARLALRQRDAAQRSPQRRRAGVGTRAAPAVRSAPGRADAVVLDSTTWLFEHGAAVW
jgi:hypothetical protein